MTPSSLVSVVVDSEFGFRLAQQVNSGPVWIVDTPTNRGAFEKHWAEHPGQSHLEGVTSFTAWPGASAEDLLLGLLDMIDLHHGSFSADPPYAVLEVLGTALTSRIEDTLREYGFVKFEPVADGFRASHSLGKANLSG